ncbi:hypothetical protein GGR54DRAFT_222853 [Hypoxylon sp. NC1633]|nr:hypothetical protein GGR54DRAFT_222853 [Hypoxylon sp. NC1633]
MDWTCGTCALTFDTLRARRRHMRHLNHSIPEHECETCPRFFRSRSRVVAHMNAKNHWPYECEICCETWPSDEERREHEVEDHYYCYDCDREFRNLNGIKMHLNSRIHRGLDTECPFCKRGFATATGLAHHLERGSCPSAPFLNRDEVYKLVRAKDPSGFISKKLIGWKGSPEYQATSRAWNGWAYECYLCHRDFSTLHSLNQHLSSPTHQQSLYHCPNRHGCDRDFATLAALMNHLESESCGYTKFENVQNCVKDIVSSARRIKFN